MMQTLEEYMIEHEIAICIRHFNSPPIIFQTVEEFGDQN